MNTFIKVNPNAPGDGFNFINQSFSGYNSFELDEAIVETLPREKARTLTPAEDPDQHFRLAGRLYETSYVVSSLADDEEEDDVDDDDEPDDDIDADDIEEVDADDISDDDIDDDLDLDLDEDDDDDDDLV